MKKNKSGLCTLQKYNQFKTRIFDAIDEWQNYYDCEPDLGIAINNATLEIEVCLVEKAQNREWIPMETIAPDGNADADAVLDIADNHCFVR